MGSSEHSLALTLSCLCSLLLSPHLVAPGVQAVELLAQGLESTSASPSATSASGLRSATSASSEAASDTQEPTHPLFVKAPGGGGGGAAFRHASTDVRFEWARTFKYLGGPIITWPLTVVNVFVGDWTGVNERCAPDVLGDLVKSISTPVKTAGDVRSVHDWWKTVGKYYGKNRKGKTRKATSKVKLGATWMVAVKFQTPRTLSRAEIETMIAKAASARGKAPITNTTMFNVFLAQGITPSDGVSGGGVACGYHTKGAAPGLYYAVYPHPQTSGIYGCGSLAGTWTYTYNKFDSIQGIFDQRTALPYTSNGCLSADTMADTVIHELSEHVTDPLWNSPAWLCTSKDSTGNQANCENADICTLYQISSPSNNGPPKKKGSFPAGSAEYISFKKAILNDGSHAYYNLVGIKGRKFYTAPQLDWKTKKCTMYG